MPKHQKPDESIIRELQQLEVSVQLSIHVAEPGTRGAFKKGALFLLEGIRTYGSLLRATENLNMSYSKAWRIIHDTEKSLGLKLVMHGESRSSVLTPIGETLLEMYHQINTECEMLARLRFRELRSQEIRYGAKGSGAKGSGAKGRREAESDRTAEGTAENDAEHGTGHGKGR
jgi:molybdate transport system regulatory protein